MKRRPVVMWVWYRGGAFHGFQNLPAERTVQGELRAAVTALGHEGIPVPAGRTDRGVHARMQVVSFRLPGDTDLPGFAEGMNRELARRSEERARDLARVPESAGAVGETERGSAAEPVTQPSAPGASDAEEVSPPSAMKPPTDLDTEALTPSSEVTSRAASETRSMPPRWEGPDLGIAAIRWAPPSFHAQWSAGGKEYRYRLSLGGTLPERWRGFAWDVPADRAFTETPDSLTRLTPDSLRARLAELPGTRKFLPFHAKSSVEKERELWRADLVDMSGAAEGLFEIVFRGSAFGRYMIRYLVGGAVAAASGLIPEETWRRALEENVSFEGLRAPACGLVLWGVLYPEDKLPFSDATPSIPEGPPFRE